MRLSAQQLRAIRQRRRDEADADERRQDQVGHLFGLDSNDYALPPSVAVGWRDTRDGTVCCLACAVARPLSLAFAIVYRESVHATKACRDCGRRLEDVPR
jgi:hypothetical protein